MKQIIRHQRVARPGAMVRLAALLACAASLAGGQLCAQQADGVRIYQEQLRVRLDQQNEQAGVGFNAGGWATFGLFNYEDAASDEHTLRQFEIRGWASLNINGVHKFYFRGLTGWDDWNDGDNPATYHGDEYTAPRVERAWYALDIGRLLGGPGAASSAFGAKVKVGRAFATIGTAFVLSMPLDMIQFDVRADNWRLMALLGKTVPWIANIDTSADIVTHQDRCFWGFELAYEGLDHHRPFAYFLATQDHSGPEPDAPGQKYDYSSRYIGLGSEGNLVLPNLRYQAELVGEFGKTYSEGATAGVGRDNICAFGADALLEYLFDVRTSPKISVEYMFGSGDADRRASSSATIGGNRLGSSDNAFNAFGFRDTGIAFAPTVSNMNIYVLGASFFPFENYKLFEKMELGSKTFFYHKANSGGPISDTTANTSSQWVGWEWDVYCNWRIASDLMWTIRYGAFQPGAAFDDPECRQFLFTAITYSF